MNNSAQYVFVETEQHVNLWRFTCMVISNLVVESNNEIKVFEIYVFMCVTR